uniref:U1-type domain-containing protein n=1 Tax=Steinernema glaseri TaxID=37863 RepID=A0A1I8ABX6_9BILA
MSFYEKSGAAAASAGHRQTWNTAEWEAKARERINREKEEWAQKNGKKPREAEPGPKPKKELLKAREYKVDLESKVGKSVVINKTTPSAETGGFYCDACDCVVKDSINFLDHINGKNHQRNMGMSMKVKRSTLSDVKERLAAKKQEKLTMKREVDEEAQRQAIKEEEARMADHSKLKKVEQSRKRKKPVEDSFQQDEDISALMGFGGFGTSKKK